MTESWCGHCAVRGLKKRVQHFQINFQEAILLCENNECLSPFACSEVPGLIVQRNASESCNVKRRKRKREASLLETMQKHASKNPKVETVKVKNNPTVEAQAEQNSFDIVIHKSYIQWENLHNLCWLHGVLTLLVHNYTLRRKLAVDTETHGQSALIRTLVECYTNAQTAFVNNNWTCNKSIVKPLENARTEIWEYLQPKMRCELGQNDSPVAALPLLLRSNSALQEACLQDYYFEFSCVKCGYKQIDRSKKLLVTFPNTPDDFDFPDRACFLRPCFKCGEALQINTMKFDSLPKCVMIHFEKGLHDAKFWSNKFSFGSDEYQVTQFIQYVHNPDHFVTWTLNPHDRGQWMKMDDLKSPKCHWQDTPPNVLPGEAHIVVWEKVIKYPPQTNTPATKNTPIKPTIPKTLSLDLCSSKQVTHQELPRSEIVPGTISHSSVLDHSRTSKLITDIVSSHTNSSTECQQPILPTVSSSYSTIDLSSSCSSDMSFESEEQHCQNNTEEHDSQNNTHLRRFITENSSTNCLPKYIESINSNKSPNVMMQQSSSASHCKQSSQSELKLKHLDKFQNLNISNQMQLNHIDNSQIQHNLNISKKTHSNLINTSQSHDNLSTSMETHFHLDNSQEHYDLDISERMLPNSMDTSSKHDTKPIETHLRHMNSSQNLHHQNISIETQSCHMENSQKHRTLNTSVETKSSHFDCSDTVGRHLVADTVKRRLSSVLDTDMINDFPKQTKQLPNHASVISTNNYSGVLNRSSPSLVTKQKSLPLSDELIERVGLKRKQLRPIFEPYIPGKCKLSVSEEIKSDLPNTSVDDINCDKQENVAENGFSNLCSKTYAEEIQSDSGYSSPGSASSCSSSLSVTQSTYSQVPTLVEHSDDFLSCLDNMDFLDIGDVPDTYSPGSVNSCRLFKNSLDVNKNEIQSSKLIADVSELMTEMDSTKCLGGMKDTLLPFGCDLDLNFESDLLFS